MKTNENNKVSFIDDLKNTIIDRLHDYKDDSFYMCDLAYTLFEGENANGTVLFSTYETKEFIKENFDLFGYLVEYCKDNMDITLNPFSEPEKAHVILLLESSQSLLSKCPSIDKFWNDKKELTTSFIKKLTKEIKELVINEEDLF